MSAVDGARAASAAFAASEAYLVFAIIATVDGLRSVEPQPNSMTIIIIIREVLILNYLTTRFSLLPCILM